MMYAHTHKANSTKRPALCLYYNILTGDNHENQNLKNDNSILEILEKI